MQSRGENAPIGDFREFPECLNDGCARRKDQGVLDEGAIRVFHRHRKFRGNNGSYKRRFPCAHSQGKNIAGVIERKRFTEPLKFKLPDKAIVSPNGLPEGLNVKINPFKGLIGNP